MLFFNTNLVELTININNENNIFILNNNTFSNNSNLKKITINNKGNSKILFKDNIFSSCLVLEEIIINSNILSFSSDTFNLLNENIKVSLLKYTINSSKEIIGLSFLTDNVKNISYSI